MLGTIDELNSYLGVSYMYLKKNENDTISNDIQKIQNHLIIISSHIASNGDSKYGFDFDGVIQNMEDNIDSMEKTLAPLTKFILPGGCESSSFLHLSRTVCRRVERELVGIYQEDVNPNQFGKSVDAKCLVFFNRLSDYLFVCARKANKESNIDDIIAGI